MNRILFKTIIILLLSANFACRDSAKNKSANKNNSAKSSAKDNSIRGNFSSQTMLHFDSNSVDQFIKKYPQFRNFQNDIKKFYADRQYAYAWQDTSGMIEQADNLYNQILNIDQEGLSGKILYKDSLTNMFDDSTSRINPEKELMLTAQYFDYAERVWGGISEADTKKLNWLLPRKKLDLPFLMDSLLRDTASSIIKNGYSYRQYSLLKNYLSRYRDIHAKNNWAPIKLDVKSLRKGDSSQTVAAIRERLFVLGDLSENSGLALFDSVLETGVKNYQNRTGSKADGIIGQVMIQQLNIPISEIIERIIVNMERCRWVPVNLSNDYLIVNIPDFRLYAFQHDSLIFSMKVVVGKSVHKTVIFNGDLKYVVFSPYWSVPPGILKNEVLPAIKKDPGYLQRNNMEWNGKSVRQKPGPKNSLGLVKFLFPNEHNIYLHDSPAKSLFNEDVRAFSHGCIRLEQPKKLAMYLLRNDSRWTEDKIDRAMKGGKEQYVTLQNAIPVFIAYLTAWVDRDGNLNLRKDVYKRDNQLADLMLKD
ncbi:MAG: L,D-transpeptidase family protein [Bacteroidetes bacterium]|nr:L,D-transpeptidase family protein [Bacteroidota bacterium]